MKIRRRGILILFYQRIERQTTDVNLGDVQSLAPRAPTLDLCLEITKSRKFVIRRII
jgi:hypothetical protein